MDQASLAWWQVAQLRPFEPRLWKNGPVRSTFPVVLKVSRTPVELGNGKRFVRKPLSAITTVAAPSNSPPCNQMRGFSMDTLLERVGNARADAKTIPLICKSV